MKKITFLLLSILSLISNQLFSQKNLDPYFDHLFNNNKMMGSIAISQKDSLIYEKSIGFSNVDTQSKNNSETKFRVGSITKTYTSVLILKAIEDKKLKLETKLKTYFPNIINADKITIEQMLKHRSGIYNFTDIDGENDWEKNYHSQAEFIDYIIKQPSNFEPGTDFEYSNTNYALLGFILEKIYDTPYASILEEKITKPLSLKNTYYSYETDSTKNEALSYNIQDKYIRNAVTNFSNHPASGGIVSTPSEVNQFLFALFNYKLITKTSLEMMLPKKMGEYGMGIIKLSFSNIEGYQHSGRIENYISDYWFFPKQQLGIVSLSNAVNINTDYVMKTLLEAVYEKTPTLLNFNQINKMEENEFIKIKGTYKINNKKESITISSDSYNLIFQASQSGQDSVAFEYKGNNTFEYANIKLIFAPEKNELYFEQDEIKEIYKKIL